MGFNVQTALKTARRHEQAGDTESALAVYDEILSRFPKNLSARQARKKLDANLRNPPKADIAAIAKSFKAEQWAETIALCHKLIFEYPNSDKLWTYTGLAARNMEQLDVALPAFFRAVEINKTGGHLANLAHAFKASGDLGNALDYFRQAVEAAPKEGEYLFQCGLTELLTHDFATAIQTLTRYAAKYPSDQRAWLTLGEAYIHSGEPIKAITAYTKVTKTIALHTADHGGVCKNLGVAYQYAGRLGEAIEATQQAIALCPNDVSAYVNLGNQYVAIGDHANAHKAYGDAVALEPASHMAHTLKLYLQARVCDWSAWDEFASVAHKLGISGEPVSPWATLKFEDNPARHLLRSQNYAQKWPVQPRDMPVMQNERIRVGYFTSDLYDHATMHLITGVLEQHNQAEFDIYLYSLNPPRTSAVADRAKAGVTQFRDVHNMADAEIVALAHADQLDIAIDLKGYTKDARSSLFFHGLAPIQINYLGYPGSMGTPCMDYMIADPIVIPEQERAHYSENVIYLPHSYQPNDDQRKIAEISDTRADHGLPENGLVLCCFNTSYKISPMEFDIWARVINQTPDAVLWVLDPGETGRAHLLDEAKSRGMDPDRMVFADKLPQSEHLARYRHADMFLDTFHYTAHTTASDALWAGIPVITMAGRQFAARVGASLVTAMNLPDLVTHTPAEYEALILHYANNRDALAAIRQQVGENTAQKPLFDTRAYTRHLEDAYRQAVQSRMAGQSDQDITVKADHSP